MFLLADQLERLAVELKPELVFEMKQRCKNIYNQTHLLIKMVDNTYNDIEESEVFGDNSDELYGIINEWINNKLDE
jgi:hypothetical protein